MSLIAVIGAGGFVGAHLVESLVLDQQPLRAIVRNYRNLAAFCQLGSAVDVRLADAEDAAALTEALRGAEVVVNLTTGPPRGIVRSTETIFEACRQAGTKRLVHLSSAVVYGDVLQPVADDDPPLSRHWMPYARAKAVSEVWLRTRLDAALDVVVLRPGIVWGVRSPHTIHIACSLAAKSAFLVDSGRGIFNGIYIDNLCSSIRIACDQPTRISGFYNVGDAETVTWRAFFEALGPALGCEASRLPVVDGERFPWSTGAAIETVQSLPMMNELYHWIKSRLPDGLKTQIKARLEGRYCYERHAREYTQHPSVDREMWHLQRVRHKLSVAKFAKTFQAVPPVTMNEGVRRTLAWLTSLGVTASAHNGSRD